MNKTELKAILESHAQRADLYRADLRGASLRVADLRGADLRGASLRVADLRGANLRGANLRGANLRGANLYGANLRGANLRGADLYRADLRGASLREADLREASLRGAKIADGFVLVGTPHFVANVGSESGTLELYPCESSQWYVRRGCFKGTAEEFLEAVEERHGDDKHGTLYKTLIKAFCGVGA